MASTQGGQVAEQSPLATLFTPERVRAGLLPREGWRPFPTWRERERWEALPAETRAAAVEAAEGRLGMSWPELPATLFLEFVRVGDRSRYEARHFERRTALMQLVVGECVEGAGRFFDDIVNGIWALCEESFWGVPAHSWSPRTGEERFPGGPYPSAGLPDTAFPVVDLFAAETGALLAWTHYLLGARLGEELPVVVDRIEREIEARILRPYREYDDWWWLGKHGDPNRPVNNWNPWIHSNVLTANLLVEADPAVRGATTLRAIEGLDAFLAVYHPDGGCDEGTSYWGRAGGSLFDCLELLASASGGALDGFRLPLVAEIGRYIYRMHIGESWYVNFADGAAKVAPESHILYRYGRRIGDPLLMAHGAASAGYSVGAAMRIQSIGRVLPALFDRALPADVAPPLVRDAWLDGIEVLAARERAGTTDGLFLAAKGGHNGESHNHNDIGNFIVALDGEPVLIDVGVGTYTRKTFGPDRYEIWTMPSAYHNVPIIDGHQQQPGLAFRARDVAAEVKDGHAQLTLDLATAYPPEAGVRRWSRTLRLERGAGGRVILDDEYELAAAPRRLALHLMAAGEVDTSRPGLLLCAGRRRPLAIRYDPQRFSPKVEPVAIDDARLGPVWGERVYRIVLEAQGAGARGRWTLEMAPGEGA